MRDRLRDRLQIVISVSWKLMPDSQEGWWQWLFSPSFGITRIGQRFAPFSNARLSLPEGPSKCVLVDVVDDMPLDPETGLKPWYFVSRVFWLHGALRVLGLDVGVGAYWRKRYVPASADTLPQGQDAQQGLAGTESGAVGSEASETPVTSTSPAAGR